MANPKLRDIFNKLYGRIFNDTKQTSSLLQAGSDDLIDLAEGTTRQFVKVVRIATVGSAGFVKIQFFDGTVGAGTAFGADLFLIAQPSDGFRVYHHLETGTLGYRITGLTQDGGDAFVNVEYGA